MLRRAACSKNYSSFKVTRAIIALAAWLLCISSLTASDWVRGSLTLQKVGGQIDLKVLGEDTLTVGARQVPVQTSGLIECYAEYGSSAYFTASNHSSIYFQGRGSFALERFEQIMPEQAEWDAGNLEATQSRVILNFRAGDLIVDNRSMLESSQYLVETPLGRLTIKRALWQMRIVFDPRSQIFDFTINCTEGRVRFTDLQGQQYTLRTGQRLAGAGSRMTPSIEVGEKTESSFEQMQRYQELASRYMSEANDFKQYKDQLQEIEQAVLRVPAASTNRSVSTRRPIVIEHAKEPNAVTPFRAEVKAPSADEADIF